MSKSIISLFLLLSILSASAVAAELALQENAPDRYVIQKGDTFWSIANKFLKEPWRWRELWRMNKDQIKNPNKLRPGDVIVLDRSGGTATARLLPSSTVKLSPSVRVESSGSSSIPNIPRAAIAPFLSQPLVVEENALDGSPFVVGPDDERVIMGMGDKAYVTGAGDSKNLQWKIFRPGKALIDPDTGEKLGHEAEYVGDAKTIRDGDPQTIEITKSAKEVVAKDRLVPATDEQIVFEYVPHAPTKPIKGRIISAYGGVADAGQYATVVINKGRKDGLDEGTVLAVYRRGRTVSLDKLEGDAPVKTQKKCLKPGKTIKPGVEYDPDEVFRDCSIKGADQFSTDVEVNCLKPGVKVDFPGGFSAKDDYKPSCRYAKGGKAKELTMPNERNGLVFVYRVFDRVSYAVVMQTTRPVYLLDVVQNP